MNAIKSNDVACSIVKRAYADGKYIAGMTVLVVESLPDDTPIEDPDETEEDVTDPVTEPDTGEPDTTPVETDPTDTTAENTVTDPSENTSVDTSVSTESAETEPSPKKGCRSTLGLTALLTAALCAGWLGLSKKRG